MANLLKELKYFLQMPKYKTNVFKTLSKKITKPISSLLAYIIKHNRFIQTSLLYKDLQLSFESWLGYLCKYSAGYMYVFHNLHENEWSWKDFENKIKMIFY